jgi:hypothetical protein
MNILLLTYDSCRFDVYREAHTPVADGYAEAVLAQSPATYTFAAHQSFFVGILPNVVGDIPFYNRFNRQLLGLLPEGGGRVGEGQVAGNAALRLASSWNLVDGLRRRGYRTVGTGAMNWFRQDSLTQGFERFLFSGTDADRQIEFLVNEVGARRPFFGFINFGETHAPFHHRGKAEPCPDDVRARRMTWPPVESGPVGRETAAFAHQRACVEFLDARLPRLFEALPGETLVILTADHGECFGEDGYWGHGVNHPRVFDVPLALFRLDRLPLSTGLADGGASAD